MQYLSLKGLKYRGVPDEEREGLYETLAQAIVNTPSMEAIELTTRNMLNALSRALCRHSAIQNLLLPQRI